MAKKPSFGPNFGLFWPKFSHSKIFLWILVLLDVRNCCKLSLYAIPGNTNEPNLRKWQKNPSFRPDFSPNMDPKKFFRGFYLYYISYIVASYHCMLFQGKRMNQIWENGKRPSFRPNFDPNLVPKNFFSMILPLLDVRNCRKLSVYAISRKTNEPNLRKWHKT